MNDDAETRLAIPRKGVDKKFSHLALVYTAAPATNAPSRELFIQSVEIRVPEPKK